MAGWLPGIQPLFWMQLRWCNTKINQLKTQEIKPDRQVSVEELIQEIDVDDVGDTTLCGLLAAMDSAPTPNATSSM